MLAERVGVSRANVAWLRFTPTEPDRSAGYQLGGEESMDPLSDYQTVFLQRKVSRVQQMELTKEYPFFEKG
jgi:hypothetical protein